MPCGEWGLPLVKRQELNLNQHIDLISYSDTSVHDNLNLHKGVHFFVDDYRFEPIYRNPEKSLEKLSKIQIPSYPRLLIVFRDGALETSRVYRKIKMGRCLLAEQRLDSDSDRKLGSAIQF